MHASTALTYELPAEFTAETAPAIVTELQQLPLTHKTELLLDATQVQHVSTSGAQIIVALQKTLASAEGTLGIQGQKKLFTQLFEEMGLGWLVNTLRG